MGYSSEVIHRKFRDFVGNRYDAVLKDYQEFLITEEDLVLPEYASILVPMDLYASEISENVIRLLAAYEVPVTLVYISDRYVHDVIKESLGEEAVEAYQKKKDDLGDSILKKAEQAFISAGASVKIRRFIGHKGQDVEKIVVSEDIDLIAVSKKYGMAQSEDYHLSPLVARLTQHLQIPTIIY